MAQILQFFIILPLIGFFLCAIVPAKKESILSKLSLFTLAIHLAGTLVFAIYWLSNGRPVLDIRHFVIFSTQDIEIAIGFYFDKSTAAFAVMGSIITFLVCIFSRFYIHRDEGFKRFFCTVLLFFTAYNILIFSGNFETLFIGWEILGICSFLLIAFYRDRYLPVKNGLKVISVYRLGDICLILTMWMSHQLWHENISFNKLNDAALVLDHLNDHHLYGLFIGIMIVTAAATKSAQLPFSSWLPRAMEGPTSSSAIFYGSLSVHLGVFLLLRTYPYWESLGMIKVLIIAVGLITSLVANNIASVQSTVKTQIAYSSITQIGLMFVEVALGFHTLALVHFAGNAFLRTYQLLVSPSVLSYRIHDMVFNFKPQKVNISTSFFQRLKNSIYILSVKEWNLDRFHFRVLWTPFKWLGRKFHFITKPAAYIFLLLIFAFGIYADLYPENIQENIYQNLPVVYSLVGLVLILTSFTERKNAIRAWVMVIAAQVFMGLSIALFHEDFGQRFLVIYLSGAVTCSLLGYICLRRIHQLEKNISLNQFHGHVESHRTLGFLFFMCCLGLIGFPFTPTFIGIDLLFSHIHRQEIILIILISLSFIFMEIAILRIYARIFLGQPVKTGQPIAYRSS